MHETWTSTLIQGVSGLTHRGSSAARRHLGPRGAADHRCAQARQLCRDRRTASMPGPAAPDADGGSL